MPARGRTAPVPGLSRRALLFGATAALLPRHAIAQHAAGVPRVTLPDLPLGHEDDVHRPGAAWAMQLWGESLLAPSRTGALVGGIASVVTLSPDRTVLEIAVRPDALFSDGSPVLATDVEASLNAAIGRGRDSRSAWRFELVDDIVVVGERSLQVTLAEPDNSFQSTLATPQVPVLPASWLADPNGDGFPPASGGFERVSVAEGKIECARTTTYFQVGRPRFAGVSCLLPDPSMPRPMELVNDRCDLLVDVMALDVPTIRENPALVLVGGPANNLCHVSVNVARDGLGDRRARQAISRAIDRQAMVAAAAAGEATVADALIPPTHWAGPDVPLEPLPAEEARGILEGLGFPFSRPLRVVVDDGSPVLVNAAVTLQDQLAYAGLNLAVDLLPSGDLPGEVAAGEWDFAVRATGHWRDPHELVRPLVMSDGGDNWAGFSSPRVDYLAGMARRARMQEYRGDLYRDIQRIVQEESPVIPLFFPHYHDAMTAGIQGYPAFPPMSSRAMYQASMVPVEPEATP